MKQSVLVQVMGATTIRKSQKRWLVYLLCLVGVIVTFQQFLVDLPHPDAMKKKATSRTIVQDLEEFQQRHFRRRKKLTEKAADSSESRNQSPASLNKNKSVPKQESSNLSSFQPTSPHAYAFVVGGCSEDGLYQGFIYNILVSAELLQQDYQSTADIVLLLQLSPKSNWTQIPEHDAIIKLGQLNRKEQQAKGRNAGSIFIQYLPRALHESFYDTVLNKFRILELTQYQRVFLLDADVMPLNNLDYLMTMSNPNLSTTTNTSLRENVIVSGAIEPANGGLFILKPGVGEYEELVSIVRKRQETAQNLVVPETDPATNTTSESNNTYRGYRFDPINGWGHTIEPPDKWVARRESGTKWDFHFAFSDQGLLYHWVKYVKKSVSIIFEDHVEHWGTALNDPSGAVQLQSTMDHPFAEYSKPRIRMYVMCHKFICDIMHFSGPKKPWLRRPPKDVSDKTVEKDVVHLWWHTLQKVDKKIGLKLDYVYWKPWQQPPLGGYATLKDMEVHAQVHLAEDGTDQ